MKIILAQINPIIGGIEYNCQKITSIIAEARTLGAKLVVFPEMAICGYPPEDLLLLPSFIFAITKSLETITHASLGITAIVGCVRANPFGGEKKLFNSAAIIQNGVLIGFQDKMLLPDYDVFSERRYFEPGRHITVWSIEGKRVAVTICEDIWQHAKAVEYSTYPRDPIDELKDQAPDLLVNLSASPYYLRRHETRVHVCKAVSQTLRCPVLYCNQVGGNDSLIFDGYSFYMGGDGAILNYAKGFEEELLFVDTEKSYPQKTNEEDPIEDLFLALVLGVKDYFHKLGWKRACFGLSGGIDSAVVAVIAKEALGKENVLALALPSRYSSPQSVADAKSLIQNLGIEFDIISIEKPFEAFLELLEPYFEGRPPDVTEENLQARIRGILLMAFSNKFGYLLLSPGNKSEMAMGYATLYGDMCGGLGVLSDVAKEQVYALAHFINKKSEVIPASVIAKPPSAELKFDQKDTDSLPDYSIVDAVLTDYVEEHLSPEEIARKNNFSLELVKELVRKIHLNEYKRRQAPPGLRVTKKSFTVGRRFPIVQHWNMEYDLKKFHIDPDKPPLEGG
jgi:NAD+ synthase (glutamine-hydrolysing)